MKYVLIMEFTQAHWKAGNTSTWSPEDVQANVDFLRQFHKQLTDSGEFVMTESLGELDGMKVVTAEADGPPTITDGPFPETKEFAAGFWIVDVETAERACEIAARLSALPGPEGTPANVPITVRPVMGAKANGDDLQNTGKKELLLAGGTVERMLRLG